jgi:hypothetical protein
MRHGIVILGVALIAAVPILAQSRGGHARGSFASRSVSARAGFGNVLYPGTGGPPPVGLPRLGHSPLHSSTFPQQVSATVRGYYGQMSPRTKTTLRRGFVSTPVVGVVPAYVGGYYGGYYGGYQYAPPTPQQVHVTVQNVPTPQPPVIINQYYTRPEVKPVVRDYTNEDLPETGGSMRHFQAPVPSHPTPEEMGVEAENLETSQPAEPEATVYLIAYKNASIYPAVGYWVEDGALHYITTQGAHNQASIDLIDLEFSERLNTERGLEFEIEIH